MLFFSTSSFQSVNETFCVEFEAWGLESMLITLLLNVTQDGLVFTLLAIKFLYL